MDIDAADKMPRLDEKPDGVHPKLEKYILRKVRAHARALGGGSSCRERACSEWRQALRREPRATRLSLPPSCTPPCSPPCTPALAGV